MPDDDYSCLRVRVEDGVATVMLDHPPLQLFDLAMIGDLYALAHHLTTARDVRVAVVRSADPDFFAARLDVDPLVRPRDLEVPRAGAALLERLTACFRSLPQLTIAVVEGACRGDVCELVLAMDLRLAAAGRALLAPSATSRRDGCVRAARSPGSGRGAPGHTDRGAPVVPDLPAEVAERHRWLSRSVAPERLDELVARVARRIAQLPDGLRLATKAAAAAGALPPDPDALDAYLLEQIHG